MPLQSLILELIDKIRPFVPVIVPLLMVSISMIYVAHRMKWKIFWLAIFLLTLYGISVVECGINYKICFTDKVEVTVPAEHYLVIGKLTPEERILVVAEKNLRSVVLTSFYDRFTYEVLSLPFQAARSVYVRAEADKWKVEYDIKGIPKEGASFGELNKADLSEILYEKTAGKLFKPLIQKGEVWINIYQRVAYRSGGEGSPLSLKIGNEEPSETYQFVRKFRIVIN